MLMGNPGVQVWESTLVIVGISDSTGTGKGISGRPCMCRVCTLSGELLWFH